MSKLCIKRRGKKKRLPEFPEELACDPLDEEAAAFVKSVLEGREADGVLKENVGKEQYYGKMEYKLTLMDKVKGRLKHLTTQLNFRLNEGKGQAIYRIGVEDNGNPIGINYDHLTGSLSNFHSNNRNTLQNG
eukprot:TRINITY_DN10728_c0_g1_i1.p5 TRINITY_DN10728_c0_g1~~TRINITY_DN10728_c0_g1_i1.p5  ORF type:complete len:132 (+),score=40.09 TRINITY_DN10728_c0_g1_i1:288-683(+)